MEGRVIYVMLCFRRIASQELGFVLTSENVRTIQMILGLERR